MWFRPSGRPISWASCSPHNGRSGPTRGRGVSESRGPGPGLRRLGTGERARILRSAAALALPPASAEVTSPRPQLPMAAVWGTGRASRPSRR